MIYVYLWPNPVEDYLQLQFVDEIIESDQLIVNICNSIGEIRKTVKIDEVNKGLHQIFVGNLIPGQYHLKIKNVENCENLKFIKL